MEALDALQVGEGGNGGLDDLGCHAHDTPLTPP